MPKCFACGSSRTQLTKQQNITFHQSVYNYFINFVVSLELFDYCDYQTCEIYQECHFNFL